MGPQEDFSVDWAVRMDDARKEVIQYRKIMDLRNIKRPP